MSDVCQELVTLDNSLKLIFNESFAPMHLWSDIKAAGVDAKTSGGNWLRYMTEVKEHYVKERVTRNLVKVKWMATDSQLADILTESLPSHLHLKLTNEIMNRDS